MSIEHASSSPRRRRENRAHGVGTGVLVATVLVFVSLAGQTAAHDDGTTFHVWQHFFAMRDAGTINADTNPVHWTKLMGVPAAFADGRDDGVEQAGFGLNKAYGVFWVDGAEIQTRVKTSCGPGRALKSVNSDGTAVCTLVSQALSTAAAGTGWICNDWCTEGSVMLGAGTWAITAKIDVHQNDPGDTWNLEVNCRLHAGTVFDGAGVDADDMTEATLPMQLVATLAAGDGAYLDCKDYDTGQAAGYNMSIIAIRVAG